MRPSHRRNNRMWPRRSWREEPLTSKSLADVLRRLYVSKDEPETDYPWFAKLARDRHWITAKAYYATPRVPTGRITRGLDSILSEPTPMFALLKRQA